MSFELIREAKPVHNSIHDLVQTLSVKLDSAARYGLYQEDAREDGFDDCAELFGRLERRLDIDPPAGSDVAQSIEDLWLYLHLMLEAIWSVVAIGRWRERVRAVMPRSVRVALRQRCHGPYTVVVSSESFASLRARYSDSSASSTAEAIRPAESSAETPAR